MGLLSLFITIVVGQDQNCKDFENFYKLYKRSLHRYILWIDSDQELKTKFFCPMQKVKLLDMIF